MSNTLRVNEFVMNAISKDFSLPAKVREIASHIRIGAWDFEGATIATEVVMMGSINGVLAENGVTRDINEVERETSGRGLAEIFKDYKTKYGLAPSVDELKARRTDVYLKIVDDYNLTLFPFVAPLATELKNNGAEQFFLSNGAHGAIKKIAGEAGVFPRLIDRIYAGDSEERIAFAKKHGLNDGDKAEFLAAYSVEKGITPDRILVVEDNPNHLLKDNKKVREAWHDNQAALRKAGITRDTLGNIQEIYVEHEFNTRKYNYHPNTGIVFPGFAPRKLCDDLGIR